MGGGNGGRRPELRAFRGDVPPVKSINHQISKNAQTPKGPADETDWADLNGFEGNKNKKPFLNS
jgi:hypothetical protein